MLATNVASLPATASASITATSLADLMISACKPWSTVISPPTGRPILLGGWPLAAAEQDIFDLRSSLPAFSASNTR